MNSLNIFQRQQIIQDLRKKILQYQQLLAYHIEKLQAIQKPKTMFDPLVPVHRPRTLKDVIKELMERQMRQDTLKQNLNSRSNHNLINRRTKMDQVMPWQSITSDNSPNGTPQHRPDFTIETIEILPMQTLRFQQSMLADEQIPL
ncbi:unnamed protein product [Diamesa serratosioi]